MLAPTDDRRSKTIKLNDEEASRAIKTRVNGLAADSRERETYQHGQEALTRAEKRNLDFSETNVFHARTAKAILQGEGVDDWLAYYDQTLTLSEHVEVAQNARQDERGQRSDFEDSEAAETRRAARQFRQAESQYEKHAEEACIDGHEEACEELQSLGWSPAEVRELEAYSSSAEDFARSVADERRTAGVSPVTAD